MMEQMETQAKFMLGTTLSGSISSPSKSRWTGVSRNSTKTSPAKSAFSKIRNRSYNMVAVSPQRPAPTKRSREASTVSRALVVGNGGHRGRLSSREKSGDIENEGASSRKRRKKHVSKDTNNTGTLSDKPTVKALSISQSERLKWTPISQEAKSVLLNSVSSSSNLVRLDESVREVFEERMELLTTRLKSDLEATTAPRSERLPSYTNLDTQQEVLQSTCLALVNQNEDLDRKLEQLKSQARNSHQNVNLDEECEGEEENATLGKFQPRHEGDFYDFVINLMKSR